MVAVVTRKYLSASSRCVCQPRFAEASRSWSLQRERRDCFRNVFDLHRESSGVLRKPTETGIGGGPAIGIFFKPRNSAVVDYFPTFVAPGRVDHLAHRDFAHDRV